MRHDTYGHRRTRNTLRDLVLFITLTILISGSAFAASYSQGPTDDALVNSTKPGNNYVQHYLSVYFDGAVYNRTYLKFDLTSIPNWATVTKAELWLYPYTSNALATPRVDVNYVNDDSWSEATLTWNNRPAFGIVLDGSTPTIGTWQTFDLLKSGWDYSKDLADNRLSLLVKEGEPLTTTVKQVWYSPDEYSASYPTNPPRLEITYSVPEPGTMMLLGFGLIGLAGARRRG